MLAWTSDLDVHDACLDINIVVITFTQCCFDLSGPAYPYLSAKLHRQLRT